MQKAALMRHSVGYRFNAIALVIGDKLSNPLRVIAEENQAFRALHN